LVAVSERVYNAGIAYSEPEKPSLRFASAGHKRKSATPQYYEADQRSKIIFFVCEAGEFLTL
jgi:hypothetical protein